MNFETGSVAARRLMDEVREAHKESYTKGEVRNLLNTVATLSDLTIGIQSVSSMSRGDVFIAKLTGGKIRPWVSLSVRSGLVVAVSMSSGDSAPRMVKSQCRYWPSSWIGTTVSLFDEQLAAESITRPYTNRQHLRDIEGHIAKLFDVRK